jgi:lysine biosynthesis protein LysW
MSIIECISCGNNLKFRIEPKMGSLVTCQSCDAQLEVVWLDPIEVDWPYDDEDFDDDYVDYDD